MWTHFDCCVTVAQAVRKLEPTNRLTCPRGGRNDVDVLTRPAAADPTQIASPSPVVAKDCRNRGGGWL